MGRFRSSGCPGATPPDGRSEGGFSLIEVLIVLAILSTLMALGSFALISFWRAQQLTGATNELLTDLRDAQARARSEETPFKVIFDVGADTYEVWRMPDPAADPSNPASWQRVLTKPLGSPIDLTSATPWTGATVVFQPRGVAASTAGVMQGGNIVLRHRRLNQDREIVITGLTARAEAR